MRTSTLDSWQPRPKAAKRKESVKKGVRRKDGTEFAKERGQLILIN
jgi:hypothetical protein